MKIEVWVAGFLLLSLWGVYHVFKPFFRAWKCTYREFRTPGPIITLYLALRTTLNNPHLPLSSLAFQVHISAYKVLQGIGLFPIWNSKTLYIFIENTENLEAFINLPNIGTKGSEYKELLPWLGEGLLLSSDAKWKKRRRILTPAFHFRILESFVPGLDLKSKRFVMLLENRTSGGCSVNLWDIVPLCTLDIIGETIMGTNLRCMEDGNTEYVAHTKAACNAAVTRQLQPLYNLDIFHITPLSRRFSSSIAYLRSYTRKVIEGRKSELVQNPSLLGTIDPESMTNFNNKKPFLDLLLYHHLVTGELTLEDIEEEVNTFLFEGHDTTSSGLSFTIYLLGLYPDIQDKVRSEVLEFLGPLEQPLTPEGLKELRYLEMVIKESLRLYPPVMHFSRELQSDIELGGKKIPKGVVVAVSPMGFHLNPTYFPRPEIFDPERFNLENTKKRHPFAYIPFSIGPRNCIGQKFAMLEMKAVIAAIVRRFTIKSRDHRDRLLLKPEIVLNSSEIVINFEPLQTT